MRHIRTLCFSLLLAGLCWQGSVTAISAQTPRRSVTPTPAVFVATSPATVATSSAAPTSTPSGQLQQLLQQPTSDLTNTDSQSKDKIIQLLETHPIGGPSWHNFIQYGVRRGIERGLPPNVVVLLLLFPVVTSIIAFARHVIGLKGFGVYTPAVLAVAFVSTGIVTGILLFGLILAAAMVMRQVLKRLNLQYMPRTAMLLWGVSILTLVAFIAISFTPVNLFALINIFPLLIIMLLTENFMETQLSSSQSEATQLTFETLLLGIICSIVISLDATQRFVILQPELSLILVGAFNYFIGRYSGLRLMEWIRFRSVID